MHLHKTWACLVMSLMLLSLQAISQNAEDEAIKKVIQAQETAFDNRDAEAWKATWLQDDKASRIGNNFFTSRARLGWKDVSEGPLKFMKDNPTRDSAVFTTDSFHIRREGSMAVVDFKQQVNVPNAAPPFNKGASREQRVLVKNKGKWLVTGATSNDITHVGMDGLELTLNGVGYTYLFADKNEEAVKVLELNSTLFPNSYNVWDSLGEAYLKVGNKEKAKECYEKSVAINPASETGKKALADLK